MTYSKIAGLCLLAAAVSGAARADEDAGFYLGGGLGQVRYESGPFKGDDTSFRVFGGYSFNRYFSAEAGYIDGGTVTDDLGPYRLSLDSNGIYASGIAKLPIGDFFSPFVKLGWVLHDSTQTIRLGTQVDSSSDNDGDFLFSGGFEFKLSEKFRLNAEFDKINLHDASFEILSLNAAYRF